MLTTGQQLLDDTARIALWQWRSAPHVQTRARLTMTFSSRHHPVTIDPDGAGAIKNIPVHPAPTYPLEARQKRWVGGGLFVMRFRPDGGMEKVVALKSTGYAVLDEEAVRTLLRWRCLPDVYTTAYVPISFTLDR